MVDAKEAARIQQAIYDEIEKDPVDEKVRERFKRKSYLQRKGNNYGENRNIHKKSSGGARLGIGSDSERGKP